MKGTRQYQVSERDEATWLLAMSKHNVPAILLHFLFLQVPVETCFSHCVPSPHGGLTSHHVLI